MQISFVLVGPKTPDNIGAAARALKAMGFFDLRLVTPCAFRDDRQQGPAYRLAMYSHDVLDGAQEFPALAEAVAGCDLVVGTTAKLRHHRHTALTPQQLRDTLADKAGLTGRVALVFGPEDTGLTNEHLDACDLLTTVPLAAPQPSINLAQAVMIYAHMLSDVPAAVREVRAAGADDYAAVVGTIMTAARKLGADDDTRIREWLKERVPLLPARDLRMLFNLLKER